MIVYAVFLFYASTATFMSRLQGRGKPRGTLILTRITGYKTNGE